ncbi:LolA family protein [Oceanobacillus halotolerans]|uniref:LolA family protein n=1 Tax=Oceanobacillus halotolerans TaxID=2663380 RepID=UPI0013DD2BD1|nr:outer membrane lipoprotein carrier protein LolA [Oceanobacillus halotolerans]
MNKQVGIRSVIVLGFVLLLAACGGGEKSQEDVVEELEGKLDEMDGYKAQAEMTMNTGEEDQTYNIDIWYKKEDFYRVTLTNAADDKESQVILKNEDGVFVLTPELNKSFKFQTEWPENSSQPYLYQSLVNDIVKDGEAAFNADDTNYVFETKTNYQSNNNLPYQEIRFNKDDYTPVLVKVLDKDKEALVEVSFSNFDTNPSFEEDDFSMEKNMQTSATEDLPVSGEEESENFTPLFPLETAEAELTETKEVTTNNGERIIMTYTGEKNFTLVQEKLDVVPTLSSPKEVEGEIVNLGHAIGALSDNSIEWSKEGVNFYLASEELTKDELVNVAQSVQAKAVK